MKLDGLETLVKNPPKYNSNVRQNICIFDPTLYIDVTLEPIIQFTNYHRFRVFFLLATLQ